MASSFARGRASLMAVYKEDVQMMAPLEDILDLLDGVVDVVGESIALALRRERVRVVSALAGAVLGLGELCAIVSLISA